MSELEKNEDLETSSNERPALQGPYEFYLPSGPRAKMQGMLGKHQRMFTASKGGSDFVDKLVEVIADLLVEVEGVEQINTQFVRHMLSADMNKCIERLRWVSLSAEEASVYSYKFKYQKADGSKGVSSMEFELGDGLPVRPYKHQATSYLDVRRSEEIVIGDRKFLWEYETLELQLQLKKFHGSRLSQFGIHVPLMTRRVREEKADVGLVPVVLDDEQASLLKVLRETIKEHEGFLDSEVMHSAPDDADVSLTGGREMNINLLMTPDFFVAFGLGV